MTRRLVLAVLATTLFGAAFTGGDEAPAPTSDAPTGAVDASTYSAEVASSDLAVDSPEAVQLGIFSSTADGGVQLLSFGEVDVSFSYLGSDGSQEPAAGPVVTKQRRRS